MGETRALRASTLFVLLASGSGYSPLPSTRPLARTIHGHRQCTRVVSRGRVPPLCAIAVGRGTQVGEQEDSLDGDSRKHHAQQQQQQQQQDQQRTGGSSSSAAAAAAQGGGGQTGASEWYGIQEEQPRRTPSREPRSAGPGVVGASASRKLSTDEKPPKGGKPGGATKGGGGKGGKGGGGGASKGSKRNPTIGKSNLDALIAQQRAAAKRGAAFGDFSGDAGTSSGDAAKKAAPAKGAGDKVEAAGGVGVEAGAGVSSAAQGSLFVGDTDRAAAAAAAQAGVAVDEEDEEEEGVPLSLTQRWKRRVTFVARTVQIWAFLFHVLIKLLRQKLVQRDEARMSVRRRKLGRYLCKAFLKLGPTFIKIGQLLSTRVDLLSTEYIEELRQLQDDVPGFGGKKAVAIIEKELGAPISELFDSFNTTSLAAASLGQVHEAWLDGKRYAVKVQRPGLKSLFEVDLKSIGALAAVLDRFDPKLDGASRDWGAIFRESSRVLYEEVDYTREGKNAERFSENFKGTDWIKAPSINWSRSTSKVLCMEFLEGIKISDLDKIDAAGVDRALLARRTAECYLAQLCRHGFFHCDPHPGNLACDAVGGGRIIFYDFGMMDELSMPLKRGLVNLIFGIYDNDVKEVVDSLEDMDVIRKGADRMTVERVTRFYLGEFQTTLTTGGKYINQLDPEEEKALNRRERAQIGQDLFSGQAAVPLQFPASFTFVFRAFTTLDGIGKNLDPSYDLTKIASPYLKELLDLKDGSAYVSVLKNLQKKLGWRPRDVASVVQSPRRVEYVNDVVSKLERGDLKLRVRVLESEAAFARIEAVQGSLTSAVMATLLLNAGVLLGGTSALPATVGSRAMLFLAGFFGLQVPVGYLKVWQLNRQTEGSKGFR